MSETGVREEKLMAGRNGLLFRRIQRLSFLVTFSILALFIIRTVMLFREAASLQEKITELRGDIAKSKRIYPFEEMEREWSGYVDKIGQVSRMAEVRSAWGAKLGILAATVPFGLAFEFVSFTAASSPNSGVMILEIMVPPGEKQGYGIARNYVDELKNTKQFGENIRINYAERSAEGREVIQIMVKFS
jgi:cell division protein ZapA (FtsZ GTPase activity inhibitor)